MGATLTFHPLLQVATDSRFGHPCKPCTDTHPAKSFHRPCHRYLRAFSPLNSPSSCSSLLRGTKSAPKPGHVFSFSLSRCRSQSALSASSSFCLRENSRPHLSNLLTTLSSLGLANLFLGGDSQLEKNASNSLSPSSLRRTSFPCVVPTTGSYRGGVKLFGRSKGFRGRASLRPRIRIWLPKRSRELQFTLYPKSYYYVHNLGLRNTRYGARPHQTECGLSDEVQALRPSMQSTSCCPADGNIEAKLKQLPTSVVSKHRYSRTLRSVFKCNCTSTENKETEGPEDEELRIETEEEEVSAGVKIAITFLKLYKREISPLIPGSCRFVPTCSEYGMQAFKRYGVLKGAILTAWRLARCNPFGTRRDYGKKLKARSCGRSVVYSENRCQQCITFAIASGAYIGGSGFDPPRWFDEQNPSSY